MAKGKLLRAFMKKDDEFYTQKELVEFIMNSLIKKSPNALFIFPCDTNNSEFVKYAKEHNLKYLNFTEFNDINLVVGEVYDNYEIVTNPPFTKIRDFAMKMLDFKSTHPHTNITFLSSTITALKFYNFVLPHFFTYKVLWKNFIAPNSEHETKAISTMLLSTWNNKDWDWENKKLLFDKDFKIFNSVQAALTAIHWKLTPDEIYVVRSCISYSKKFEELGYKINHKAGWYIFLNYSQFGMCKLERKNNNENNQ